MKPRYCLEIAENRPAYYSFSYVDTPDNLANFLFSQMKVDAETETEFRFTGDPFKIVLCRIPRSQRESFLKAIDMLPGLMAYDGREGYKEYCLALARKAVRFLKAKEEGSAAPLQ